jgi:hypothetical protein
MRINKSQLECFSHWPSLHKPCSSTIALVTHHYHDAKLNVKNGRLIPWGDGERSPLGSETQVESHSSARRTAPQYAQKRGMSTRDELPSASLYRWLPTELSQTAKCLLFRPVQLCSPTSRVTLENVPVMQQAVEHGADRGGITHQFVPLFDRRLEVSSVLACSGSRLRGLAVARIAP